jgi:magnesium chelatase family protein
MRVRTATTQAVALVGVEGHLVEVEADIAQGIPAFSLVGVPDTALSEARDRVRAAIKNSGFDWPQARMTLNLTPAALPKRGASFDLACAAAILAANGEEHRPERLSRSVLLGELGLDGRVRPGLGVLPAVIAARSAGFERVVVPRANAAEARLVEGLRVTGVESLRELFDHLKGLPVAEDLEPTAPEEQERRLPPDLADVLGQPEARWAMEVAAAGGHHVLLKGPPGAGKTMLAERLPGILPPLTPAEALEVSAIHSIVGRLNGGRLITTPPFQVAHHTASAVALVGGGGGAIKPGLVSLAHRGVLFLDEAPEFKRDALEALRQPLGDTSVVISRAVGQRAFPCSFQLVMAANPCPCAASGGADAECTCGPAERRRYQAKLSGPLLDRVDLHLEVRAVSTGDLMLNREPGERSTLVAARVLEARARMSARFEGTPWRRNADVPAPELKRRWPLPVGTLRAAYLQVDRGKLTARGFDRTISVAWTIADLRGLPAPGCDEVDDALRLRGLHVPQRAAA